MSRHAYVALLAVQVFYGLLPVAGKTVFRDLDPLAMTSLRILGAAYVLLWLHVLRRRAWPRRGQWRGLTVLAFFGIMVNMGFFAAGLERTHPVNATLLITTIPVFTYLLAVLTGRESVGPRRLAGILLALSGAAYIVGLSGFEADLRTAVGDLLVLTNALSFSWFLVISKRWSQDHDALDLSTWMFLPAAIVFLPIALWSGMVHHLEVAVPATWGWMAFIVLAPTVGAYVLNATALRTVSSSTVAAFIYLQPPISALAAWIVLGDPPDARIVPAALLIFAGVWLVARRRPRVLEERGGLVRA